VRRAERLLPSYRGRFRCTKGHRFIAFPWRGYLGWHECPEQGCAGTLMYVPPGPHWPLSETDELRLPRLVPRTGPRSAS
jgi:hypothetical protein